MMRSIRGYWRTIRQYASSPKTRYEYRHYAWFLLGYMLLVLFIWGGIYLIHETIETGSLWWHL
ncbi:MAG: hypothetical protein U0M19_01175 [Caecibacter sp.]|nr:hypothetical protein [Caecibacter sp.]